MGSINGGELLDQLSDY